MEIELFGGDLVALRGLPDLLPGRPDPSTIFRWRTRGCRGVRLGAVLIGGQWYTSRSEIERFVEATTARANGDRPRRSARERQKVQRATARTLKEAGVV
jgi:hypothetical protein